MAHKNHEKKKKDYLLAIGYNEILTSCRIIPDDGADEDANGDN